MSLVILFHFLCAQHVSDINISIIRSLRLCCWITTHTTNLEQNDRCGNSTAKSQAPDDGYINVRNMLSTYEVKYNNKWHQVGLLFFNYYNDARSNKHKTLHTSSCLRA